MAAYLVMTIAIEDHARWKTYREAVMPLITRFGGRHVSGHEAPDRLEGLDDGRRIAMFEFASMADIRAFFASPAYAPVKDLRRGAATLDAWVVPDA